MKEAYTQSVVPPEKKLNKRVFQKTSRMINAGILAIASMNPLWAWDGELQVAQQSVEKKSLNASSSELYEILNWVPDGRMAGFLDDILYSQYVALHPEMTRKAFKNMLISKDMTSMRQFIETQANNKPNVVIFQRYNEFASNQSAVDFFTWASHELNLDRTQNALYEVFKIFQEDSQEKELLLYTMRTDEFRAFHDMLRDEYGIDPNRNLLLTAKLFNNPRQLSFLETPEVKTAFKTMRNSFPEVDCHRIEYIMSLQSFISFREREMVDFKDVWQRGEIQEKIKRGGRRWQQLHAWYGVGFASPQAIEKLCDMKDADFQFFAEKETRSVWIDMQKTFPHLFDNASVFSLINTETKDMLIQFNQSFQHNALSIADYAELLKLFQVRFDTSSYSYSHDISSFIKQFKLFDRSLMRNTDFISFLRGVPQFETIVNDNIANVSALIRCYYDQTGFLRLNEKISEFKGSFHNLKIPEVNIDFVEEKMALLNAIQRRGFTAFVLTENQHLGTAGYVDFPDSFEDFKESLRMIQSADAETLYNSLVKEWKMQEIELNDFLLVGRRPEYFSFFTDAENAKKAHDLINAYGFAFSINQSDGKETHRQFTSLNDAFAMKELIEQYDIYIRPDVVERTRKILSLEFVSANNRVFLRQTEIKNGFNTSPIVLFSFKQLIDAEIIANPSGEVVRRILVEDFGVSIDIAAMAERDRSFYDYYFITNNENEDNLNIDHIMQRTIEKLKNPSTKGAFEMINRVFDQLGYQEKSAFNILQCALAISDHPEYQEGLFAIGQLGYRIDSIGTFRFIHKHLLNQPDVMTNLQSREFADFFNNINKTFYGGQGSVAYLSEISDLFTQLRADATMQKVYNSDRFHAVIRFLRTECNIVNPHPSTFNAILQIARYFDETKLINIIQKLREKKERIGANDMILLCQALKDQKLEELLFDRELLIAQVKEKLPVAISPRSQLDQVELVKRNGMNELVNNDKIEQIKTAYSENPPLEKISSVQLLRLYLLLNGLRGDQFLHVLGDIIHNDIADTSTERGGLIGMKDGRISLTDIHSHAEFDGEYQSSQYQYFIAGMSTFHCHARTIDESIYSGPSGWIGANGGDVSFVDAFELADVVFTSMGHPKDENGVEIKNSLLVNADIYWVDTQTTPHQARIVDLGIYTVPYLFSLK